MFSHLHPPVLYGFGGIVGVLVFASTIVLILKRQHPAKSYVELSQRINSWWIMVGIFSIAILLSRTTSIIFFAFVSFLALKEYFSLIPTRHADRRVLF